MGKINIYLASHFFDAGGTMKTQFLADNLRSEFGNKIDLYVPQENDDINDKTQVVEYVTDVDIAVADNERLNKADILIADLDGVEIDSGVSAEIGYVAGRNSILERGNMKPPFKEKLTTYIIGFTTDIRINEVVDEALQDVQVNEYNLPWTAKWRIANLKDNHLYRNLYTRGLIWEWGAYIRTNPSDYISDIITEVRYVIASRGGLDG